MNKRGRTERVLDLETRVLRYYDATADDQACIPAWPAYKEKRDRTGRHMTAIYTRVWDRVLMSEYTTGNAWSRRFMIEHLDRDARILYELHKDGAAR